VHPSATQREVNDYASLVEEEEEKMTPMEKNNSQTLPGLKSPVYMG